MRKNKRVPKLIYKTNSSKPGINECLKTRKLIEQLERSKEIRWKLSKKTRKIMWYIEIMWYIQFWGEYVKFEKVNTLSKALYELQFDVQQGRPR